MIVGYATTDTFALRPLIEAVGVEVLCWEDAFGKDEGRGMKDEAETRMRVSVWWDRVATDEEHAQVLRVLRLNTALAGVPWAFLPDNVKQCLLLRITIDPTRLSRAPRP